MPNYCNNTLEVNGSYNDLNRFWNKNKFLSENEENNSFLSFNKSHPLPQHKENEQDEWYNWRLKNWGTKWDACECSISEDITIEENLPKKCKTFFYYFDTAWTPPVEWMNKVSTLFPKIQFTITYEEAGCDFWGKETYVNGELIDIEEMSYSQHIWSLIDKDILKIIINKHEIDSNNLEDKVEEIKEDLENEGYDVWGNIDEMIEEYIKEYKQL